MKKTVKSMSSEDSLERFTSFKFKYFVSLKT